MRGTRWMVPLFALGCGEALETSSSCEDVQSMLDASCGVCHGTMTQAGGLSLADLGAVVGSGSTQSDLALIEPGFPDASYLLHKLEGTHLEVGGLGDPMPPTWSLEPEQLAEITAWIAEGAVCEASPWPETGDPGDTGDDTGDDTGEAGVDDGCYEVQTVLDGECTGCHGTYAVDGLDLRDISRVVGVLSPHAGLPLITPGDASASYLIDKIRGTHLTVGGAGVSMPPGKELSDADLAVLETWIDEGASCEDPLPEVIPAEYDPNALDQAALFVCDGEPASSPGRLRRIDKFQLQKRVGLSWGHEIAANPLEATTSARYTTYAEGATLNPATLDLYLDMLQYTGEPWQGSASYAREALQARQSELACMYTELDDDEPVYPDRACLHTFVSTYLATAVTLGLPSRLEVDRLTNFAVDVIEDERLSGTSREESITMITSAAWLHVSALFESELGTGEVDEHGRRRLGNQEVGALIANLLTDRGPNATSIYLYENGLSGDDRWTDEKGPHMTGVTAAVADGSIQEPDVASAIVRAYAMGTDPDREDEWIDYGTHSLHQRQNRAEEWMADRIDRFFLEWFDVTGFESGFQEDPHATTEWHDQSSNYFDSSLGQMRSYRGWNEPDGLMVFTDSVAGVVTRDRDVLRELLTGNTWYLPANEDNGGEYVHRIYGVDHEIEPTREDRWNTVPNRAGFLTHPIWLATHGDAFEDGPSLIHRGKWVREKLFCQTVPPLELVSVEAMLSPNDADQSARHRIEDSIETQAECMGCHQYMNDLGKPFELYNHAGLLRVDDHGSTPDGSTVITNAPDPLLNRSYASPTEFTDALADSPYVKRCFIRQTFRYFAGRDETMADTCVLSAMEEAYDESGGSFVEMLAVLATHDGMLYRTNEEAP